MLEARQSLLHESCIRIPNSLWTWYPQMVLNMMLQYPASFSQKTHLMTDFTEAVCNIYISITFRNGLELCWHVMFSCYSWNVFCKRLHVASVAFDG